MTEQYSTSSQIDFSSVLAAAVHDMKNSLFLLIQSIENLALELPDDDHKALSQVANVHYEASRLNTNLVQILSLYRAELEKLPITVDECFLYDLLHDVVGSNLLYIEQKKIDINIDVDESLSWYLDSELVYLLVNDVVVNALKYGTSNIRLSAQIKNQYLVLTVEDDGDGYPDSMLENSTADMTELQLSQGRTGLGLFFARLIAAAHRQGDKCGEISLTNGGTLGGSVFEVKLP
ncbi:sensor histidine kinase [Alteromonas halophila]|uniref:histidine kinase n=1 Tax=Alteromonas halophila TaxID=516698 RepID=A0A918JLH5_9ALTE|nr:HAMP domain-containing sensor histidine kinase [Alteromonas halophila]GGW88374.1 sensor histidine kinase [Alteromonas halophila]